MEIVKKIPKGHAKEDLLARVSEQAHRGVGVKGFDPARGDTGGDGGQSTRELEWRS